MQNVWLMTNHESWELFKQGVIATKWQEWVSFGSQIISVWYAKKNSFLTYPTGIIGVLLAAYLYFFIASPPLYADAILNIYYFLMSLYGWYNWTLRKDNQEVFSLSFCQRKEYRFALTLFAVSWMAIHYLLIEITDSNTPILDSLVSSSAIVAMWLMARRKIENWLAWIFSNLIAIPLNFYKGFMLFVVMYILFLALAILGYIEWKKAINKNIENSR
jgi:nicotinamide mononucleotide transporter